MTTTHTRLLTATFGALAVALTAAAMPARADDINPDYGSVSRAVSTAGLNLASAADQALFRHRLAVAARRVCEDADFGEPEDSPDFRDCYTKARAEAWAKGDQQIAAAEARSVVASAKP
jgi:UrcA family protein